MAFRRGRKLAVVLSLALLSALQPTGPAQAEPIADALRLQLEQHRADANLAVDRVMADFYRARNYRPAWIAAARRDELLARIEACRGDGLRPADYAPDLLRQAQRDGSSARIAERDLLFTATLVRFAGDLRFGKVDPRGIDPDWNFSSRRTVAEAVRSLQDMVAAPSLAAALAAHAPNTDAYRQLRSTLVRYREIAAAGGWPMIAPGPTLAPGQRDERVRALRSRLQASSELPPARTTSDVDRFDDQLAAAVRVFQARNGLEADGLVGRRTLSALNTPVAQRIDQLRVNLERLRWIAQDLVGGDRLLVDTAGFGAQLHLDGKLVWSSRAVVGRPDRQTPDLRAFLNTIVLNPQWIVPPTILREDLLPVLAARPGHLAEHDMRVVDWAGNTIPQEMIDWAQFEDGDFPYHVFQSAGPENPLGRIKFVLPNRHAVYLHDTPARGLFKRSERALSSGCIRLENPLELATLLLGSDSQASPESLQAEIDRGKTRILEVHRQIPVLMVYFTTLAGTDGSVGFRRDIYQRDAAVLEALNAPPAPHTAP